MSTLFLQIKTGTEAVIAEEPTEKTMSILELMTSGGIGGILIMAFLAILSIFAIYIFLERFGAIRNANKVDPNFMNNIKDMVLDGKLDAAQALCTAESTPVARMIEKGISRIGKPLGLLGIPRFPLNRRLNSLLFSKKNDWMVSGEDNSAINARLLSRLNSPVLR